MSFRKNDVSNEQISLFSRFETLTGRERKFLQDSWAIPFAEILFPAINEEPFSILYSSKDSRPNTPVNIIIGGLILKELTQCTDEEFFQSLLFDIRYQTALHTVQWDEQPFSDRTFSRFRRRCLEYQMETGIDLIHETICGLSREIAKVMGIGFKMLRMDSLMIESNIRRLSRLELLYTCAASLAQKIPELPEHLRHYTDTDDENDFIYRNQSETIAGKIETVLKDAQELLSLDRLKESKEYQILLRVLEEQSFVDENGNRKLKDKMDATLKSTILQSPYDPDATFRKKQGQKNHGYAANVIEAVNEENDKRESVILDYEYAQNITSDTTFGKNAIEKIPVQEEESILVADGAYCGRELHERAEEKNIQIINTNLTGKKPELIESEFTFSANKHEFLRCPAGNVPHTQCSKDGRNWNLQFSEETCKNCPQREKCHPKIQDGIAVRKISIITYERAKQMKFRQTEEFKKYSAIRNGVETIPSVLRRKYHIDHMPVRGLSKTRLWFGFKIAAMNFVKLCRHRRGLVALPTIENRGTGSPI